MNNKDLRSLGPVGFKAVKNIMERWGMTSVQQQAVFHLSESCYAKYCSDPTGFKPDDEQLMRISYILNIHATLRTIFTNPDNVYGFMSMKNDNAFFNGRTPIDVISTGDISMIERTYNYIDSMLT